MTIILSLALGAAFVPPLDLGGLDGSDRAWVALEGEGAIAKVDLADGVLRRVRTRGGGPHNITVAPDGTVVVALWASDRIMIVRRGERTFVELGGRPHDVKIARNMVVVANQATERVQLVRLDGTFRRRIVLKADPHDLAVDPPERRAWVTLEGSDDLAVVHLLRRREPVRYVDTPGRPHDILFAPDGRLWVTDWEGALHVFGPHGRHLRTIALGVEAHHMAFTPDERFAWITDHGAGLVFVVRVRTLRVIDRIAFPGEPHHVAALSDGLHVLVADHEHDRVIVYGARSHRRVDIIRVGDAPHGVWSVPA